MSCTNPKELKRQMKVFKMPLFKKSSRKSKKYMIESPKGKWIHFGSASAEHFKDSTGTGIWSHKDHGDRERQRRYLLRACKIRDGTGRLTWNNPETSNFYSIRYLWSGK